MKKMNVRGYIREGAGCLQFWGLPVFKRRRPPGSPTYTVDLLSITLQSLTEEKENKAQQ